MELKLVVQKEDLLVGLTVDGMVALMVATWAPWLAAMKVVSTALTSVDQMAGK